MNNKALKITEALYALYPDAVCGLHAGGDPYKLFVMAVLSAQCTDERVNAVSAELFKRFPTPLSMAESKEGEIEKYIYTVGLYNSKAKALREACKRITEVYGGEIPSEMEDLLSLRGVGRKVANLLRGDIFGLGGIVADTHCIRISVRLGLCTKKDPVTVERELTPLIPAEKQSGFCHRIVIFGREYCTARNPSCHICPLAEYCDSNSCNN